ncbi:MAG: hypothetical protein DLM58_08365 [Pseudonocardiales bacterium]|nr:MAG: hypothetical protein DLM58_08365 [Pseudonocardiales bacterium]
MRNRHVLALVVFLATIVVSTGTAVACRGDSLNKVRAATAEYLHLKSAIAHGYGELKDAAHIACIDKPGVGGMGIHYANPDLIGDPNENARTPELLVYEPLSDGRMRLVAVEYVVFQAAWKAAGHQKPPSLFGQEFELTPFPNRYGLDAFYELHAWIWKHNPRGIFDDWNPRVSCAYA